MLKHRALHEDSKLLECKVMTFALKSCQINGALNNGFKPARRWRLETTNYGSIHQNCRLVNPRIGLDRSETRNKQGCIPVLNNVTRVSSLGDGGACEEERQKLHVVKLVEMDSAGVIFCQPTARVITL